MNRARSATDPQRPLFVEPTSETVGSEPAPSTAWTVSCSEATGVATRARSAPSTASASEPCRGVDARLARPRRASELVVRIPADHVGNAHALRGQADGGADQPRADQSKPLRRHYVSSSGARMSSARRKARSSDWRAFSRGSQSDM